MGADQLKHDRGVVDSVRLMPAGRIWPTGIERRTSWAAPASRTGFDPPVEPILADLYDLFIFPQNRKVCLQIGLAIVEAQLFPDIHSVGLDGFV